MKPEETGLLNTSNSESLGSTPETTVEENIEQDLVSFLRVTRRERGGQKNDANLKRVIFNNELYEPLLPKTVKEDLRQAIKNCDFEQIKKMVDERVNINAAYPNGMNQKDAENVFKKLKSLFSNIKKWALPYEINRLGSRLQHSEEYQNFAKANAALKEGYDFSGKQPVDIVEEIVKYIEIALIMKSHCPSSRNLKLDNPNAFSGERKFKPTILDKFNFLLNGVPKTRNSSIVAENRGFIELARLQLNSGKAKKTTNSL